MNETELKAHVTRLRKRIQALAKAHRNDRNSVHSLVGLPGAASAKGLKAEVIEFLKLYAGTTSAFFAQAREAGGMDVILLETLDAILDSFLQHVHAGLQAAESPRRLVQMEVVSDYLEQAQILLGTSGVHPAAPIVIVGATLEEYLRTTVEKEGLSLGNRKPSIQAYVDVLRDAELLSKQDAKDITAWAGLRNDAAHGRWDQVAHPDAARLMLAGVNLFLQRRNGT